MSGSKYAIGTIHPSKDGDIEIIDKVKGSYTKVIIKFLNTGYIRETDKSSIRRVKIRDHTIKPKRGEGAPKVGSVYSTTNSGDIMVDEVFNHSKIRVKFLDSGNYKFSSSYNIRTGKVKDVELLGRKERKPRSDRKLKLWNYYDTPQGRVRVVDRTENTITFRFLQSGKEYTIPI